MPALDRLPAALRDSLLAEIDPGEELRWCGQPLPARLAKRAVPLGVVIFLLIGFVAGACLGGGIQTWRELSDPAIVRGARNNLSITGAVAIIAFGAILGLCALTALAAPLFARAKALRTVYALTNTRVFIVIRSRTGRIHTNAVEPGHPLSISRHEHPDGSGDILLYPGAQGQARLVLAGTLDPRTVERLIRTTFDPPD
jgi:hypothetical protein